MKLLPCPHCGSEDVKIEYSLASGYPYVYCNYCWRRDTIARWNRRTLPLKWRDVIDGVPFKVP